MISIFINHSIKIEMLSENVEIRDGELLHNWLWHKKDQAGWLFYNLEKYFYNDIEYHPYSFPIDITNEFCNKRSVALTAGANSGLYAKHLAALFETVLAFEPDPVWFDCLMYNAPENNITKCQIALGREFSWINIKNNPDAPCAGENECANRVDGTGGIQQIPIDSLNIDLDLIILDVEGYEGFVLQGAEQTIKRSKPVIVVELHKHFDFGEYYNFPNQQVHELLLSFNYKLVRDYFSDQVYIFNTDII